MKQPSVILDLIEIHITEKAIKVAEHENLPEEDQVWLPLSQIEILDVSGQLTTIEMPEDLALQKGLI